LAARGGARRAISARLRAARALLSIASMHVPRDAYWRQLFHRWFVEFNPLYLLSAALVLGGCFLVSRGLVGRDGLAAPLGIALVAEVYAASLIGGAAFLTRIGLRRPAVMLALLAVLFQWDMTLHTETCAYLGWAGACATGAWLLLFAGKLYALAWGLRVRFSRTFAAAALVAASGLVLGPRVVPCLGPRLAGAVLAVWLFTLAVLYRRECVTSAVDLDDWGRIVLRRATRAVWLLSGVLVGVHVLMWWRDHDLPLSAAILVSPLVLVRRVRSEAWTWAAVLGVLVLAALAQPSVFWVTSLLAGAALCLRVLVPVFPEATDAPPPPETELEQPYRSGGVHVQTRAAITAPPVLGAGERARAFTGALVAVYLAAWTLAWSGGPWPAHVIPLDVALAVAVAIAVFRARMRPALVPLAITCGHFILQARLLPMPTTSTAWGATIITIGFLLLGGSLFASYRLRPGGSLPKSRR
jgi:hypothetical protein